VSALSLASVLVKWTAGAVSDIGDRKPGTIEPRRSLPLAHAGDCYVG
jgi:hypothetical protein